MIARAVVLASVVHRRRVLGVWVRPREAVGLAIGSRDEDVVGLNFEMGILAAVGLGRGPICELIGRNRVVIQVLETQHGSECGFFGDHRGGLSLESGPAHVLQDVGYGDGAVRSC
jgi:hypothetical protein